MNEPFFWLAPVAALIGLLFAWIFFRDMQRQDEGTEVMRRIGQHVREGAMAYLRQQYRVMLLVFCALAAVFAILAYGFGVQNPWLPVTFLFGGFFSALAGFIGMQTATRASTRTAAAARSSLDQSLRIAFRSGAVIGLTVVGLGLGNVVLWFLLVNWFTPASADGHRMVMVCTTVLTFSMGASFQALFARVGGGIYTKAADVGADLVGKVEAGIPEDDPRNPAVIADNVGDNVGDVAGMGADLFESYVGSIVGAMVLGATAVGFAGAGFNAVILPLVIAAAGIIVSILGTFFVSVKEGGNPQTALNKGTFGAAFVMLPVTYVVAKWLIPGEITIAGVEGITSMDIFLATIFGLIAGVLIGIFSEYYTSKEKKPVHKIAAECETGPATCIISGVATGMESVCLPVLCIAGAILTSHHFAGLYGIAIAALGMLSTTGIQLAVDAYGPIADNAGGLAEMAELPPEVRERTDNLDAVVGPLDLTKPTIMAGLFVGGMLPFLFSAMSMRAVGEAAKEMIIEVRRQFREIPGLLEGKAVAEYSKCVDISTAASLKKMIAPSLMALIVPVVFGFISKEALGGLLAGVTVTGVLLAIFQSNAGGAWDNAKKYIEEGHHGGKGSEAHKAGVIGDTVGDPFKDTSGPSLNILIKLMAVVALVIAPLIK